VTAFPFLQVTKAVTADFALVIYANGVGSVVPDDVVDAIAKEFHAPTFNEFAGFLMHDIWSDVSGHAGHFASDVSA